MPTELMRTALQDLYRQAHNVHPGLLIQRGYQRYDNESEAGREAKTRHIQRICATVPGEFYRNAYRRWQLATADPMRFRQLELALAARLFIGLTGGGMLETGCAISQTYGAPYLPGSSIKGTVRGHVRGRDFAQRHAAVIAELFGADADPNGKYPLGLSGLVNFHDAWWVPESAAQPLVEEVVTSHHLDYYGREGAVPASDLDSPIPNAQIGVRGQFLFVLEGPIAWLDLAEKMLVAALSGQGIGAKTRTGYGLFDDTVVRPKAPADDCPWVDETIKSLAAKNRCDEKVVLRGKGLAEAWRDLSDEDLKEKALQDIKHRWQEEDWWDEPPGKASRQAKAIYEGN